MGLSLNSRANMEVIMKDGCMKAVEAGNNINGEEKVCEASEFTNNSS